MSYSPPIGNATTTQKGVIQLSGDLGGTASAPLIPALATKSSQADFNNLSGSTIMKEDLYGCRVLPTSMSVLTQVIVHVSLGSNTLHQLALAFSGAIAASDTDYWTVTVMRVDGASAANIAYKTTRTTGGEPIATYVDWNFDIFNLSGTATYAKGEIFLLKFAPTGSPAALLNGVATYRIGP